MNPIREKVVLHPRQYGWSSYRATADELTPPDWLTTDWILGQFGTRRGDACSRYRDFVKAGRGGAAPWDQVQGQIYLGSEDFVARHQPNCVIRDIPRRQTQA
ncbi:hypothetical protein [Nitrospira sp. KM1]|uniref:hypothetical protein n=1 Tax=Nitrospira sp. KM1 TaxID=1936990 RepID=UPI0018D70C8A|nr:hypothetical protein [Nitrospira sp. KM1]